MLAEMRLDGAKALECLTAVALGLNSWWEADWRGKSDEEKKAKGLRNQVASRRVELLYSAQGINSACHREFARVECVVPPRAMFTAKRLLKLNFAMSMHMLCLVT